MFIDSHCHLHMLDLEHYDGSLDNVIKNAAEHDVGKFLCVSTELAEYDDIKKICQQYPDVYGSVGIHPNEPFEGDETESELRMLAQNEHIIAIGETGLDYFRTEDPADQVQQQLRFKRHINISIETQKPLIIHSRLAPTDTIKLMREYGAEEAGGVMHCFCETLDVAEQAIELGFYISISGIVTFKNASSLQEVAQKIPLEKLLIETDCPFLAPVPFRGKPNQPAYVKYVAEKVAELRGCHVEDIAYASTKNFIDCFKLCGVPWFNG